MKVYFAADHAGFELKHELLNFVRGELGHEIKDCGAFELNPADDYPEIIARAARALARDAAQGIASRAIVIGGSGQGEAMAANRFKGVRCAVYYGASSRRQKDAAGQNLDIIHSACAHNDANALALGARFVTTEEAKAVVKTWLETPFSGEPRHLRRIHALDRLS